jgi:hypothetical protein
MGSEIKLNMSVSGRVAAMMGNARQGVQQFLAPIEASFDQAGAVVRAAVDLEENIQRSAERWLASHQAAVARMVEQTKSAMVQRASEMAEMMTAAAAGFERYRIEEEPEACALLCQAGWVGMNHNFSIRQLRESVLIHATHGEAAMNNAILEYFAEGDFAVLDSMGKRWMSVPYLRERKHIIHDAIDAHKRGKFTLSIPALLPFVEGLSAEILGACSKKAVTRLTRKLKANHPELWEQAICDFVEKVVYKDYQFGTDSGACLNRHGVLHGRDFTYPSAVNSTRVFLLIDAFAQIWHEKQKALAPTMVQ